MERVGILINKLQEQLKHQAEIKNMLVTAQMLQAELLQKIQKQNKHNVSKVSVVMPHNMTGHIVEMPTEEVLDEPVVPVEEPMVKAEPVDERIRITSIEPVAQENASEEKRLEPVVTTFTRKDPSGWLFDPTEVPTLAHQDKVVYELNDTMLSELGSLNESLKEEKAEVAHVLQETPIRDLKKAISINERHRFIHDLFRGDETMYERSIKTINGFNIFAEAEYWIQRELKLKLGWDVTNETVKSFDQLIKRRFS